MNLAYNSEAWWASAQAILLDHARRYPALQMSDLCKLIHQAAFRANHAIKDVAAARQGFVEEWNTMGTGPIEPLPDLISPDGEIVRIHLRSYAQAGGKPQDLFEAFLLTANTVSANHKHYVLFKECAITLARIGKLPWQADDLGSFFLRWESLGCPAPHHSMPFKQAHRPAYRVVAAKFLDNRVIFKQTY